MENFDTYNCILVRLLEHSYNFLLIVSLIFKPLLTIAYLWWCYSGDQDAA